MKLFRPQRDGMWVITRHKNDGGRILFRPDPFRDILSTPVRQLVVEHVDIERFLFDGFVSTGDRLAHLNVTLLIGKHPANDPADRDIVVHD